NFRVDPTRLTDEAYQSRIWFLYKVLSNAPANLEYFAGHPFEQPASFARELDDFNKKWLPA
ncbi:hypothetical protein HDU88_007975, partial [Geranomyces variabilis]